MAVSAYFLLCLPLMKYFLNSIARFNQKLWAHFYACVLAFIPLPVSTPYLPLVPTPFPSPSPSHLILE